MVQPPITTVRFLVRLARAISLRVPQLPPIAITASLTLTTRPLRSSPIPVGSATDKYGLAAPRSRPGSRPIVRPPTSDAPWHAAAMTPPRPPHTKTTPRSASRLPTCFAISISSSVASSPGPTTATYAVLRDAPGGGEADMRALLYNHGSHRRV